MLALTTYKKIKNPHFVLWIKTDDETQNELNEFPKLGYVYIFIFSESEPFTEV